MFFARFLNKLSPWFNFPFLVEITLVQSYSKISYFGAYLVMSGSHRVMSKFFNEIKYENIYIRVNIFNSVVKIFLTAATALWNLRSKCKEKNFKKKFYRSYRLQISEI